MARRGMDEPNLKGFWKDADMKEYFRLFDETFATVKGVDPDFKVGGPAVCGGSDEIWISAFMDHIEEKGIALDFVTRHHYTTELPRPDGHYGYPALSEPEMGFDNLRTTRDIIDSHEKYRGLPIHITEYNTSYVPNAPLHDTVRNAAYIAHQLSRLGELFLLDIRRYLRGARGALHAFPRRLRSRGEWLHPQAYILDIRFLQGDRGIEVCV